MTENQNAFESTSEQVQNAFRFSLAMAISMSFISILLVIIGGPPKGLLDLTTFAILVAITAIFSTWLSRNDQHILGILLLISSLLLACIVTALTFSGFGPVVASVTLLISFGAGSAALPRRYSLTVNIVSILFALGFMALDIFEPFPRQPNEMPALTWGVAGLLFVIFGIGIIRNFNQYNFRTKLIISFMLSSAITLGVLAIFNQRTTTAILTENLGRELNGIAETRSTRIGDVLKEATNYLEILSVNDALQQAIVDSNESYVGDLNSILIEIKLLDEQWRAGDSTFRAERLANESAKELLEFQNLFPDNAEVFLTDLYGALVGSTNLTSDYFQADEDWWQAAYNNGDGAIFISTPEFDESVGAFSVLIASPVFDKDSNQLIGILRTTYLVKALQDILGEPIGETGEADLFIPGNPAQHIHEGQYEPVETSFYNQLIDLSKQNYAEITYDDAESIVSQAPVSAQEKNSAINELGWFVVVHQEKDEVFAPITAQTRAALGLVIVIIGMAAGLAVILAQVLVTPISRLTATALEVADGDLTIRAKITSQDEVGTLANAFNEMTSRLSDILANLEERVASRTKDLELASEVGQRLSLIRATDIMLAEAVELIRDRFDLYYTQVYLTDPTGRSLVLHAGTGDVGRTLLQRSHRLPVDLGSLNGIAATERRPVIVENTETSPMHRPNPLLPDTRSEMAIPLLVGARVVGVLDMQSDQPGALNTENLPAFLALSGQLAITIANAALFEEAEQTRETMEQQASRLASLGWQDFFDAIERKDRLAYTYDRESITPLSEPLPESHDQTMLVTPIRVAGASIGQVQFQRGTAWTEDDFAISNAVSHQVAQQIENLRLLAQAEQYQNETRQALQRMTREGWDEYQERLSTAHGFVYQNHEVRALTESDRNLEEALSYEIKVRDEAIGQLSIAGSEALSEEDADLVMAVNEQLSAHLENLRLAEQTQLALNQTETLYNIGRRLNSATNEAEILAAVNSTAIMTGCTQSSLMYIDQDSTGKPEWLTIVAAWSKENTQGAPVGLRFPGKDYPLTSTLLTSPDKPVFISNIAAATEIDEGLRGRWLGAGFRAIVILPLGQAGLWYGLLTFGWNTPHEFSEQERTIFEGLISLVTPVVQSNRLFEQVQTRAEREQALRRITEAVRNSTDPATIMRTAVRELGTALGRQAQIRLVEKENNSD